MKIRNVLVIPFLLLVLTAVSCGNSKSRNDRTETVDKEVIKAPEFDADSAYQYIQVQADFGPRVPNTQAHKECGEYLAGQLEKFGAKVYNQYADLIAYDGTILKSRNIIGAYKPESKKRILLCAHWDSRPYADNDPDPKNHHTPILGVNDGASGVGVLLEIARQIQKE
ncbi:M28 family peptidase, partial [Phocaeicola vulgatus]